MASISLATAFSSCVTWPRPHCTAISLTRHPVGGHEGKVLRLTYCNFGNESGLGL